MAYVNHNILKENGMMQNIEPIHQNVFKILIADPDELYCTSLAVMLEDVGVSEIHFACSGRQAVDKTIDLKPNLILLDRNIQDMDSFAALSTIKYVLPESTVIMSVSFVDTSSLAHARELGVDGFYSKSIDQKHLVHAIETMLSNKRPFPASIDVQSQGSSPLISLNSQTKPLNAQKKPSLTKKEKAILALLANGDDNQKIAEKVSITKNTLKTHLRKIYAKLEVSNRTQAAIWAVHNKQVLEPDR